MLISAPIKPQVWVSPRDRGDTSHGVKVVGVCHCGQGEGVKLNQGKAVQLARMARSKLLVLFVSYCLINRCAASCIAPRMFS